MEHKSGDLAHLWRLISLQICVRNLSTVCTARTLFTAELRSTSSGTSKTYHQDTCRGKLTREFRVYVLGF